MMTQKQNRRDMPAICRFGLKQWFNVNRIYRVSDIKIIKIHIVKCFNANLKLPAMA